MRMTVDINEEVLIQAKQRALSEGKPLHQIIEDALRLALGNSTERSQDYKLQWTPERGRLLPGVRLDDRASLLDLMDQRD